MLSLVVAGSQFYSLKETGKPVIELFTQAVDSLTSEISGNYICYEDKASEQLFILLFSDFILGKIIKWVVYLTKEAINRWTRYIIANKCFFFFFV